MPTLSPGAPPAPSSVLPRGRQPVVPAPRGRGSRALAGDVGGPAERSLSPLLDLAAVPGDGPFLAYDLRVVADRVRRFSTAFCGRVAVRYAVKCNPDPHVLRTVAEAGGGFEIASSGELGLVQAAGADPADVLYSNPVKPPAHVAAAWAAGVRRFAVDSPEELSKIAEHAPGAGVYVRLRVDDARSRFPLSAKFGTPLAQAGRLLRDAQGLGLVPEGLTFHVGSQCTDVDAWANAVRQCAPLMRELLADGLRLRLLDLGGGFPAQYADAQALPALSEVADRVLTALAALPYVPEELVCEPGRAIVAESAVLGATVIGRAERNGRRWVYTDVGAYNGLMEAAQTGGTMAFPVTTSRTSEDGATVRCTVTGPSCDSSDTLLDDVVLPADLSVGDRVYLASAGAYSLCYASAFNGFAVPRPVYLG